MSMRSKALENIRAVMEREDNTYRRENGYEEATWDHFRPEPAKPKREGNFLAGRFLGIESSEPVAPREPEPEPEVREPEPELQNEEADTEPEIREVIPLKDGKHSWLYKEVVRAINDAARENSGTKIIAVFVPVVQNSKELEELPVSESVELTPVSMDDLADVAAEPADHVDDIIPETKVVPDPELVEAFQTMEEKLDESIAEAEEPEIAAEEADKGDEGEEESVELLPLPDPAELEGLPEVEELGDEFVEEEGEEEEEEESKGEPMIFVEQPEDEEAEDESKGEPMVFEDIPAPEGIPMPEGLEDDEIEIYRNEP